MFIDVNSVPGGLVYGQGIKVGTFNNAVFSMSSCQDKTSEIEQAESMFRLLTLACPAAHVSDEVMVCVQKMPTIAVRGSSLHQPSPSSTRVHFLLSKA